MARRRDRFPLPWSIVFPFVVMTAAASIAAFQPLEEIRRCGWSIGLIALGCLMIGCTRQILIGQAEQRIQAMAMIAQQTIEYAGDLNGAHVIAPEDQVSAAAIDEEWRRFNKG